MSFFTIIFIKRVSSAHINKFIFINFLLFVTENATSNV